MLGELALRFLVGGLFVSLFAVLSKTLQPKTFAGLFGAAVSVVAAGLGNLFGPVVGGLFLAFPAILPAALTLMADHRGRETAGEDASGAIVGSLALACFGAVVWLLAPRAPAWQVLGAA